jgi:putative membrane protein
VPVLVIVGAVVTIVLAPAVGVALVSSSLTVVIGSAAAVARVFNEDFDFSISEAGDGVRLDRGLLQRRHETIPFGRIQAVRLVQPLFWRPFGWWRLEVDVARQHTPRQADQEGQRVARTLIPVTHRDPALWLAARVFPGASVEPPPGSRPPRRAMFKAPLSYHLLAAWSSDRYAYARTGRVQAATVVAPLDKMQSVRFTQGPVQRALRLASTHVDTAGQRWQASAHCRDENEAETMLWHLSERARQARRVHRTGSGGIAVATSG